MGDEIQAIKAGLARSRRHHRREQGRSARRSSDRGAAAARCSPTLPERRGRAGPRPSTRKCWSRPRPPAMASRSCWPRSTAIAPRPTATEGEAARLRRAEAQVWSVLVDRLHARVRALEGAEELAAGDGWQSAGEWLRSVAAHELDPYSAADAILVKLFGIGGPDPGHVARRGRRGRGAGGLAQSAAGPAGPYAGANRGASRRRDRVRRRPRSLRARPGSTASMSNGLASSLMPRCVAKPRRSGLRTSPLMKTARLASSGRKSTAAS